jgi:hypothetical protein
MQVNLHTKENSLFGLVSSLGDKKQRERDSIPGRDKRGFSTLNWVDCPWVQHSFLSDGYRERFPVE